MYGNMALPNKFPYSILLSKFELFALKACWADMPYVRRGEH